MYAHLQTATGRRAVVGLDVAGLDVLVAAATDSDRTGRASTDAVRSLRRGNGTGGNHRRGRPLAMASRLGHPRSAKANTSNGEDCNPMSRFSKPTGNKKRVAVRHNRDVLRLSLAGTAKTVLTAGSMASTPSRIGTVGRKMTRSSRSTLSARFVQTSNRRAKAKQNPSGVAADFGPLEQRI